MKYLEIYLPRQTQELHEHNYKTLITQIKLDLNKWKNINCSWVSQDNIIKTTILPKLMYLFRAITIKLRKKNYSMELGGKKKVKNMKGN